jgi:hypothetical protein
VIGHLEPGQGNLGILPAAKHSPRYSPALADQRITTDLSINSPDAIPDGHAAAPPLAPANWLAGCASRPHRFRGRMVDLLSRPEGGSSATNPPITPSGLHYPGADDEIRTRDLNLAR